MSWEECPHRPVDPFESLSDARTACETYSNGVDGSDIRGIGGAVPCLLSYLCLAGRFLSSRDKSLDSCSVNVSQSLVS